MTPLHTIAGGLEPLLITIPEAGSLHGVKRSTVYRLLKDGRLKAAKLGARRLVTVASVRELAATLAKEA